MGKVVERIVNAERVEDLITVFGSFDENIKRIEEALNVRVVNRGTDLRVSGDEEMADKAVRTLEGLLSLAAKGETIDEQRVRYLITLVNEGNDAQVAQMAKDVVCITAKGKPIKAKTVGQQNYMKAIMKNTITIGVGPAGTGKTYLAVAAAVAAFREQHGEPHHPDPPGGGSGGAAGLPARRLAEQGRPLSAAAVRRAVRYAGGGDLPEVSGARLHRGRAAGLYARPHAGRQLHHSGRGPEHHPGADENVPDPSGLRLQGRSSPAT